MKITLLALLFFLAGPYSAHSEEDSFYYERVHEKQLDFIIEKACEDIRENADVLVETRKQTDAATHTAWLFSITRKLSSQPVAAIQLFLRTNEDPSDVCITPFIEEEPHVVGDWCGKSTAALHAFSMRDPREEQFRQSCLKRLERSCEKRP